MAELWHLICEAQGDRVKVYIGYEVFGLSEGHFTPEPNIGCPCPCPCPYPPMPMGFGWAWVRYYVHGRAWVGVGAILLFMGGHEL
jgi:hypothetical protein